MFKFIGDLLLKCFAPTPTMRGLDTRFTAKLARPDSLSSVAVLQGGVLFISSIITPPGGWRNREMWKADVEILLIYKGDLKKVEFVGPTYDSVTGMIGDVVKTYDR